MMKKMGFLGMIAIVSALAGCGGGSGSSGIAALPQAQKATVVAFSVVSTSKLPARINTIKFTAYLPAGVIVPTDPGKPNTISASALVPGYAVRSAFPAGATCPQPYGTYSAAVGKVTVGLLSTTDFSPGEFVLLNCKVQNGTTLTASDFTSLNGNLSSGFKAFGFSPANGGSTVDLTSSLNPYLNAYFFY